MADYKVVIVAPTCFYYQVPIFRRLAAHPRLDLMVYFCSAEAITGADIAKKYKSTGTWGSGSELLAGYKHKVLRNYSPAPSYTNWPFGLVNLGVWNEVRKDRPDAVILMSWMNPTWWLAILVCVALKIPFLYMTDQNIEVEPSKPGWKTWPKRLLLGRGLFRLAAGFLCAGTANQMLYKYYGVPDEKLVPFAFTWAHGDLLECADGLKSRRQEFRTELGIPENNFVVLYCGRLSKEKSGIDLLRAYRQLSSKNLSLLFVGDGPLRKQMEDFVHQHDVHSVYFSGFQGRLETPKFYALADVLVVPSHRETWGMVVNEAMCFGLPVIASDQVGASKDLILDGYNGLSFPESNVKALASRIEYLARMPREERQAMGDRSVDLIKRWSQKDLAGSLVAYLDRIHNGTGQKKRPRADGGSLP